MCARHVVIAFGQQLGYDSLDKVPLHITLDPLTVILLRECSTYYCHFFVSLKSDRNESFPAHEFPANMNAIILGPP